LSEPPRLTLYFRSGCTLCDEMQDELLAVQSRYGFALELVDVDSSAALVADYGHKVPVLTTAQGEELCHYFLDHSALDGYFSGG
jgi:thiol-disulfide isomerase/thioredoxin